jgi:outer membrane lipoprotein LolB
MPVELREHQQQLTAIKDWQFSGKLGIKAPGESASASIQWQQTGTDYSIQLHGPLGQKSLNIEGNSKKVTLKEKGKTPVTARNAEALLKRTTGWNLPLQQLDYWIRGLPSPSSTIQSLQLNEQGLIKHLQQKDWKIDYSNYKSFDDQQSLYLPQKLIAHHQELRLTLIIRTWKIQ